MITATQTGYLDAFYEQAEESLTIGEAVEQISKGLEVTKTEAKELLKLWIGARNTNER